MPFYAGGKSPAAMRRAALSCEGYIGPGHSMAELPALVAELDRLRREAGREHLPFEIITHILPVDTDRPLDDYKRLRDLGVTALFLPPFDAGGVDRNRSTGLGRASSIADKRRTMEHYAETILSRLG